MYQYPENTCRKSIIDWLKTSTDQSKIYRCCLWNLTVLRQGPWSKHILKRVIKSRPILAGMFTHNILKALCFVSNACWKVLSESMPNALYFYLQSMNANIASRSPRVPQTAPAMTPRCSSRSLKMKRAPPLPPLPPSDDDIGAKVLIASQPGWQHIWNDSSCLLLWYL